MLNKHRFEPLTDGHRFTIESGHVFEGATVWVPVTHQDQAVALVVVTQLSTEGSSSYGWAREASYKFVAAKRSEEIPQEGFVTFVGWWRGLLWFVVETSHEELVKSSYTCGQIIISDPVTSSLEDSEEPILATQSVFRNDSDRVLEVSRLEAKSPVGRVFDLTSLTVGSIMYGALSNGRSFPIAFASHDPTLRDARGEKIFLFPGETLTVGFRRWSKTGNPSFQATLTVTEDVDDEDDEDESSVVVVPR